MKMPTTEVHVSCVPTCASSDDLSVRPLSVSWKLNLVANEYPCTNVQFNAAYIECPNQNLPVPQEDYSGMNP